MAPQDGANVGIDRVAKPLHEGAGALQHALRHRRSNHFHRAADETGRADALEKQIAREPTRGSANQARAATLAPTLVPTLAQVSRNPTVRLNTSRRAVESGSGQK